MSVLNISPPPSLCLSLGQLCESDYLYDAGYETMSYEEEAAIIVLLRTG